MDLKHVGVKPKYDLELIESSGFAREIYVEWYPDGTYKCKYWNKRTLKEGCGEIIKDAKIRDGLIYCPYCDEWFNKDQFV